MLTFLVIGLLAGALTGVPIGPVNVAVIDASYRHTLRRALAVGFGGACGDFLYSALGILGVTPFLENNHTVKPILYGVSGSVLLVYGFLTARSQPVAPAAHSDASATPSATALRKELWQGFTVGLALIVLNPAAIVTWVVLLGPLIPKATHLDGVACAIGVFVGSAGWFSLVAYLTHKGKHVLGEKAAWIPRVIGVGLMIYAAYLIAMAVRIVVA
ncbi:MAG TPA: LysE family transporter [Kofleriaceae bacterium]|nr:LysE family transporter [Kofleriaceae bacterium]